MTSPRKSHRSRLVCIEGLESRLAPAVFNAANEQAVALFLVGAIRFGDIARVVEGALAKRSSSLGGSLDAILAADANARRHVQELSGC